jgi:hypothetical protein
MKPDEVQKDVYNILHEKYGFHDLDARSQVESGVEPTQP